MPQHPKVTVDWAVNCLERALDSLSDGGAEARVRRQFHQLMLALERDGYRFSNGLLMVPPPAMPALAQDRPSPGRS
jgi:hypothetical protein